MTDREGQRLGNYRLQRLLGKGSFAEVYLGEHLYLRNYAAIKILRNSLNEKEEQLFLSEARTIANLTHPNIVRVHEFAIERSTPFLVMDYTPGGTLRHRYPVGACLSLEETVKYVKEIAAALQYAHNQGIVHRDVKPDNILQGAAHAMLSDFGISIHTPKSNAIATQEWAGTLLYMAPEQFLGHAVFASDQYALAILAYEWLCGACPFAGSPTALAYQHSNVAPPRLREKDPSLPEAVETVILKALAKTPEERYPSVINFARALESANQSSSYTVHASTKLDRMDGVPQPVSQCIFLSHVAEDDVTHLQTALSSRDISVREDAGPEPQEEKLRQAIRAAQMVLLVLTPQVRSSAAVKEHLRIAALYKRPIFCIWVQGEELQHLLPVGAEQATIIDARGQRYKQALEEITTSLERLTRGASTFEPPHPGLDFEPRNPYKGLRAFTQQDRADFFGRESLIQELLSHLNKMGQITSPGEQPGPRFLAIIGPSGSGKSSVVMAGLLPRLQEDAISGSADWLYLDPIVPGKQPMESLAHLLAARFPDKGIQAVREALKRNGEFGLHRLGLALVEQARTQVVLIIDQFEELFSSDVSESERQFFIDLLVTAATQPQGPILVLLTMRADFYDRPFAYPALGRLIQQQCPVLPLSNEDLRDVIERPASLSDVRLTFDEDLVGDLLFDMQGQVGALPLLEFALDQLFHHRREHRLTRYAYQEIGGIRGALSRHAESTYQALPSQEHQRLARTLFSRLLQFGSQVQEPTRRRANLSEFTLENAEQSQKLREVIDAFIAARLLIVNQFLATSTLEISHEALIREWPRLANWLQEAREDIPLQQNISNDAREWELRGKPKDRLYRGSQLKEALAWQLRNMASGNEAAFLRASAAGQRRIAVTGLIFGLIGVITWFIPIILAALASSSASLLTGLFAAFTLLSPIIAIPSSITGLILSIRGLRSGLYSVKAARRWVAIVGLILSSLGLLIFVALVAFFIFIGVYVSSHPNIR